MALMVALWTTELREDVARSERRTHWDKRVAALRALSRDAATPFTVAEMTRQLGPDCMAVAADEWRSARLPELENVLFSCISAPRRHRREMSYARPQFRNRHVHVGDSRARQRHKQCT